MNISKAFIERPIATSLLMAGILLVGIAAYPLLPVAPLPEVDFPTIQVSTSLPGASPETIASSVTQPLERQFGEIPGVTQMTSSSTLGNSAITVQFDLHAQYRRRGAGHPDGDQCRQRSAADQSPLAAHLPEGQSGGCADPGPGPHLRRPAADAGRRLRREHPGPAYQPDLRRRPGQRQRPAEARGTHPARSGEGGLPRPLPRGYPLDHRDRDHRQPEGHDRRPDAAPIRSTTTTRS